MALPTRVILPVLGLLASLLAVPGPATATVTWEKDFAQRVNSLENPVFCQGVDTWYGGPYEYAAHYTACIRLDGDILKAVDAHADGDAAVMKWKFFLPKTEGRGYETAPTRKGVCIYTGGSEPPYRSGICNKNLPENGLIQFWAGKRLVSGSTQLSDMRFGSSVCIAVSNGGGLNDPNCDLLWLSGA